MRHRPIGLGVQGLADVYMLFDLPFDSAEANELNTDIFETIYYGSLEMSMKLAEKNGHYETYQGSPMSKGMCQFDLWGVDPTVRDNRMVNWNWSALKVLIKQHGVYNSLLVAPMPTASTSQIMGNNECFEPYTSNIYLRRTMAGEFVVVNKHLIKKLIELDIWSDDMKNRIIQDGGSVQGIIEIPKEIKLIYRTVWELSMKSIIDQAASRGPYVCQSQSMNLFVSSPSFSKMSSMHFYAWEKGLKTGMYYLRTKPAAETVQFTIDPKYEESCDNCSG
jgi:ribonucleoside-diphosphate reductase alpha chain